MTSVWRLIQGKKNEDRASSPPTPRLGAIWLAVLFSAGSRLSFKKHTKSPPSFSKKQASAAETNRSLYQCC